THTSCIETTPSVVITLDFVWSKLVGTIFGCPMTVALPRRGNRYSQKHVSMNTSSPGYWHFSFDQMTQYDLPAVIDLVRNKTGHKSIGYIGHSQGRGHVA